VFWVPRLNRSRVGSGYSIELDMHPIGLATGATLVLRCEAQIVGLNYPVRQVSGTADSG